MGWNNCKNAKTCGHSICFEKACKKYDPKERTQQTNADRIRSMSDEELEKAVGHRSLCYYIQDETNFCNGREVCGDCIREWLKQPADMRGEKDG